MKLSEFKKDLNALQKLTFLKPDGEVVPPHFHITEVGLITKNFIDCGGTVREEKVVNFQLWEGNDLEHQLSPYKLNGIIELSEKQLNVGDHEVEIEYQADTIGKYGVNFDGTNFILTSKKTDCLAKENCGIPKEKQKVKLSELQADQSVCCSPEAGCCN